MISDQLDAYPGHERFAAAILGLLATCDRFVDALRIESRSEPCSDGPCADFALGVVSLARTLRAIVSTLPPESLGQRDEAPAPAAADADQNWLR